MDSGGRAAVLFGARQKSLAVDAVPAFGSFEDFDKQPLGGVERLTQRFDDDLGNTLYHGTALLDGENAGRNMELHQRRAEACCRSGRGYDGGWAGQRSGNGCSHYDVSMTSRRLNPAPMPGIFAFLSRLS